ncbi:MAG TPA: type IX secretion system membrane protein PorP/SprF, partial [Bacteroidetes bacterium]|nr:type IX secretion system membrane protein PorP/SprF [Bacteroidota bacterium]
MKQKLKNIRFVFFIIFISINMNDIFAQDLNQTNTRYFPLYLNPALTGHFRGSYRIGGTFRDQGKEFMHQGYKTMNLYMDSPISISFSKYNWIGAGIQIYKDVAGELPFSTTGAIVNLAYHFVFDKKYKNIISIGMQYGSLVRKIDDTKIRLES